MHYGHNYPPVMLCPSGTDGYLAMSCPYRGKYLSIRANNKLERRANTLVVYGIVYVLVITEGKEHLLLESSNKGR